MTLEEMYARACATPSDINEHLPLLRELASKCSHVTEFGTRWANGSTIAFLAAQPDTFVAWDLEPAHIVSNRIAELANVRGKTRFEPRVGNTLEIIIEPTDLLFIDTLHTCDQLWAELRRHCDPVDQRVRKYLVFHDTETFGLVGEDGKPPGLRTAIVNFQKRWAFPLWELMPHPAGRDVGDGTGYRVLDLRNNNGLVVLRHVCADGHSPNLTRGYCEWCGRKP